MLAGEGLGTHYVNEAQENRAQTRELICKSTISGLPLIFSGENMKWVNSVQHPKIYTWTENNPDLSLLTMQVNFSELRLSVFVMSYVAEAAASDYLCEMVELLAYSFGVVGIGSEGDCFATQLFVSF